jgi:methylthioribose-1-phosphate isomerase
MREAVRRGRDLLSLARRIEEEEEERCRKIAENGFSLLRDGISILTHCNAGPLATCGIGTALGPLYIAKERGVDVKVFVTETRPKRQGARLTVWELKEAGICVRLIADTAVGYIMERGYIDAIFVGADRIAENGDCANKIGTYQIAVLAKFHKIPFYVAAPSSTFDKNLSDGSKIIVEERGKEELTSYDVDVLNPAFDITPSELITGIITEDGILRYGA